MTSRSHVTDRQTDKCKISIMMWGGGGLLMLMTSGPLPTAHLPSTHSWKLSPRLLLKTSYSSVSPSVRLYPSQDRAIVLSHKSPWMVLLFSARMLQSVWAMSGTAHSHPSP